MELFDKTKMKTLSLSNRISKCNIREIAINPDTPVKEISCPEIIDKVADSILKAKKNNKAIIIAFGAHLIKNGLCLILRKMVEEGYVTHLATNGASSIHDWEFSYQGKSEEDVEKYVNIGQFGIWEETGKYLNLAIISGAYREIGYGESIGEMIAKDRITIPKSLINEKLKDNDIKPGVIKINHPYKEYSIFECCYKNKVPITVHPGFGYDIIYTHALNDGASIGKASEIDFLGFVASVSNLEGGVYISIGSAIMSPMIFEKALSMARNVAIQEERKINNFMIVVNDIKGSVWDFNSKEEPPKSNPAYYERLCKSFKRMGAREMYYVNADNREFLLNLYHKLKEKEE
ncbi:MAG: hypothetical protein Q8N99_00970 [Nanoarchaeota archaeon]|nr:hypothetical protein [Nanoarchaeota archaeon]